MNNSYPLNSSRYKLNSSGGRYQYQYQQMCLDDLVSDDHKIRLIWDFVSQMDLSVCLEDISSFNQSVGRPSTDPQIFMTLWIYSIIDGNYSARKLEELCKYHDVYKWICGGVSVNRTSLSEFRSSNPRKFDDLLVQCLAVMVKGGLISDSDFSQDGTRVKANAGNNSYRREESLINIERDLSVYIENLRNEEKSSDIYEKRKQERQQRLAIEKQARVKAALRELQNAREIKAVNAKKNHHKVTDEDLKNVRASVTDPEVRRMKMGDSGYRLAYNVQFATGLDSRVIYGVDLVNTLDMGTAAILMSKVKDSLKKINLGEIKCWIADSAYLTKAELIAVNQLFPNCLYYAPPQNEDKNPKKGSLNDCEAIRKWRDLINTDEINKIYRKRCSTAEFSNMQIKNRRFEFSVRGMVKARGAAILHAIAQNVVRAMDLMKFDTKNTIF